MSRRPRFASPPTFAVLLLGISGCYDVDKGFDDFVARDQNIQRDAGSCDFDPRSFTTTSCTRTPGNRKEYLITISPAPFATDPKPNMMHAWIEINADRNMVLTATNYHYDRGGLVGEPTITDPITINSDGTFDTGDLSLSTPPEASCATPDVANEVVVRLRGGPVCDDTEFACGSMCGSVSVPVALSLDGSTFTAQLIKDGMRPEPLLDCDRTPVTTPCKTQ
jgi:hypothetical protein